MTIRKKYLQKDVLYFCTFTCYNWLNLFEITNCYDYVYKWFDFLKTKRIKVVGYVIMPNHVHLIVYLPAFAATINKVIGNGKRFLSYEIVKRLKSSENNKLLLTLEEAVTDSEKRKNTQHMVFESSFEAKIIESEKFLFQKLHYIHRNPVSKKWNLVEDYWDYPYSSAGFYEKEDYKGYQITSHDEIYID